MPTGPLSLHRRFLRGLAALLVGVLLGSAAPLLAEDPPTQPSPPAQDLGEAFQKGPIALSAQVMRRGPDGKERSLPLFQVPVLRYQDRVAMSLSGEAFDPRVTHADWSLIVVFLPRTVAPTDRGVMELRLKRKGDEMVAASFTAPYDAIPMFFLVPDSGGSRKILTDVSAHLGAFRSICLKLSDLTEQRAHADQFLAGLDSIRKDQSPASYDSAVLNFMKAYNGQVAQDLQVFLAGNGVSNLDKFQFLAETFRQTNLLVPTDGGGSQTVNLQGQSVSGPLRPASAYISIVFDLVQIFQNLWPGHQFQYVPALARDFNGLHAQLWYGDWIHTTGDVRGAIVFSPCRWKDADPPAFSFDLPPGGSLLQPFAPLLIHPEPKSNFPFALFGHRWQLVIEGPKGECLDPLPLLPSQARQAFLISPGPALDVLRKAGVQTVKAHIEGRWGFQAVASSSLDLPVGLDPAWRPTPGERGHFMLGEPCAFRLPAPWAACVGRAVFRPAKGSSSPLDADLTLQPDGSRLATFHPLEGPAGPGTLDLYLSGAETAALSIPITLLPPLPVVDHVEAHQGEAAVLLSGHHLGEASKCVLGGVILLRGHRNSDGWTFESAKGPLPGEAGTDLQGELQLEDGRNLPLKSVQILPPRPQVGAIRVIPERATPGLPLVTGQLLVPTSTPVMLSILSDRKGTYPFGHKPRLAIRSVDDPSTVKLLPSLHPAGSLRLLGRGQRIIATFRLSDLFGASAAGHFEIQVLDATAGASAWMPLPALFLDPPIVQRVFRDAEGTHIEGSALETIEAVGVASTGPWTPLVFDFRDGHEQADVPPPDPDGSLFLRLYGWPDLVVRLQGPIPPPPPSPKAGPRPDSAKPRVPTVVPVKIPDAPKPPDVQPPKAPVAPSPPTGSK